MDVEQEEHESLLPQSIPYNPDSLHEKLFSTRYKIAFLGFLGFASMFTMRVTMSIAIVEMITDQGVRDGSYNENCPAPNNVDISDTAAGTFNWTTSQQANILSAPFYGYLASQIPGGYLASRYSAKNVFGYSVLLKSVLSILNPPVAYLGVPWLFLLRIMEGLLEGVTIPAFSHLTARWAPKLERTLFYGLGLAGCSLGLVICYPVAGSLCTIDILGGWPLPFLLNGFLGIIWFLAWVYVATDSPDRHPRISKTECQYIITSTQTSDEIRHSLPWREMIKSPPFYAFLVVVTTVNTVDFGLLTGLPLYFSNVLNYDVRIDGFVCAIPWFCNVSGTLIASYYTDYLRGRHLVTTTFIRKVNQLLASVLPGVFLIAAGYAECHSGLAICFISIATFFFGFYYAASFCSSLDMAPYFAGTLAAIANTVGSVPGIGMPIAIDRITDDNIHSKKLWLYCFYVMGVISTFGGILFAIFGSGEIQPWGNPSKDHEEDAKEISEQE